MYLSNVIVSLGCLTASINFLVNASRFSCFNANPAATRCPPNCINESLHLSNAPNKSIPSGALPEP